MEFGFMLAIMEMKDTIRQRINKIFLKLTPLKVGFLGAISGALVPVTVSLPFFVIALLGFAYTLITEFISLGATGLGKEAILVIFLRYLVFYKAIIVNLIKYTALSSAFAGTIDILVRFKVFTNPKSNNFYKKIYANNLVARAYILLATLVLVWPYSRAIFGLAGALFISLISGLFFGIIYRAILLTNLDFFLKIIDKFDTRKREKLLVVD